MKNALRILMMVILAFTFTYAQRAKIGVEAVTPHRLTTLNLATATNSVSTGLNVVGNNTFVYLCPLNIANTDAITNAVFEIVSKPSGSAASLTTFNTNWAYFQPDAKGQYDVKLTITTALGTDDTTVTFYSADYVGVGNFEGVAGSFPKCMTCHAAAPRFSAIYDRWKVSGHAQVFQRELENSDHYGPNCMKCHTTGYDHNAAASNGGFDDVATTLGWSFTGSTQTTFDSIKTDFPGLMNLATIGCESCHGAGSEHAMGGDVKKIAISVEDGVCAQCHDEPWRHNKVAEYENSLHSEALWSSSFKRVVTANNLSNCARCHEAEGYIAFSKDQLFDANTLVEADHIGITCATCHDPHGNDNVASLRATPVSADTLGNGFAYTSFEFGTGKTCMNCHKARVNGSALSNITSSHWGPHHSTQTDVLLGKNAADFGIPFISGSHMYSVENACVGCHMAVSPENGDANRDKVGGHTFGLHNPDNGIDYTVSCTSCHGPKTSFDDFEAASDLDGDGQIEAIQDEIDGLVAILADYLPPAGPAVSWEAIRDANDVTMKKAYHNYQLIAYDGSRGMHNTKFAVDVLTKSIVAIGGVVPVELVSFSADVNDGSVTLNWETASETNNRGFDVERKTGNSWNSIAFVNGKGTTTSLNSYSYSFKLEGKASFRLKQVDLDGSFSYSKVIEVTGSNTPKNYALSQNYPNPFNPSTTIKFSLPFESNVKVVIYSLTGEVVKVLMNSVQTAGNHEVQFNSNDLGAVSSGIYFYSLEANAVGGNASFKQTKKMILMK